MDVKMNRIELDSGREVIVEFCGEAEIVNIPIFDEKLRRRDPVGRALVLLRSDSDSALLLDICVYDGKHRRQGIATDLIKVITDIFPHVHTSHFSRAGRRLCLKNGFIGIKSQTDNLPEFLIHTSSTQLKEAHDGPLHESGSPAASEKDEIHEENREAERPAEGR